MTAVYSINLLYQSKSISYSSEPLNAIKSFTIGPEHVFFWLITVLISTAQIRK